MFKSLLLAVLTIPLTAPAAPTAADGWAAFLAACGAHGGTITDLVEVMTYDARSRKFVDSGTMRVECGTVEMTFPAAWVPQPRPSSEPG